MKTRRTSLTTLWILGAAWTTPGVAAQPEPTNPPAPASARVEPESPASDVVVELLDAGAEPDRRVLRYALESPATERATMTMSMEIQQTVDSNPMPPTTLPTVEGAFRITTGAEPGTPADPDDATPAPAHDDAVPYRFAYESFDLKDDSPMAAQMRTMFDGITDVAARGLVLPNGRQRDIAIDDVPNANPALAQQIRQMEQSLRNLTVIFPDAPVGVGATWRVSGEVVGAGAHVTQTFTYTLTSDDVDGLTLDVKAAMSAAEQPIIDPAAPDMKVTLRSFEGTGDGRVRLDLRHLTPIDSRMTMRIRTIAEIPQPDPSAMSDVMVVETEAKTSASVVRAKPEETEQQPR